MTPNAYLLCGKVGCGKSTYARALEAERKAVRLTVDEWMVRLFGQHLPCELHAQLLGTCMELVYDLAERLVGFGVSVTLDTGFWKRTERDAARERFSRAGARVRLVTFDLSDERLLERLASRNATRPPGTYEITPEMFRDLAARFEPPGPDEELFETVRAEASPL